MESRAARIAVAVVSVAAIAVLFVVLSGGDDDPGGAATTSPATTTASGGGDTTAPKQDKKPKPKPEFTVVPVTGGEPETVPVDVKKGDEVRIAFESDIDGEVHIHGYDIYVDLVAGKTEKVSFPAEIDGVFEIEDHATGAQLAKLTVTP